MKAVVEIQLQAEFLRGESAGGEAGAELIEHVGEQEGQRFEQDERVVEFHGFFEHQRRIDGNQGSGNYAAGEFLQFDAALAKALAKGDVGKSAQGAKVTYAPHVERLEQAGSFI